ncbi:acyl-CoA dehydrogenase family protein [Nocardiopsis alba]|uniref:acyl-CoA dehydrogenase family protein n=1 Tax=Nocardiopsis alba TaxID=53437 RepID=UPI00366D7902
MVSDDLVTRMRESLAGHVQEIRAHALSLDHDPSNMEPYLDLDCFKAIRRFLIRGTAEGGPEEHGLSGYTFGSCLDTAVAVTEICRGDVGMMLACPGPALAGVAMRFLGDEDQREYFYRRVSDGRTWTFFAMTEPAIGSDATAMTTRLEKDGSDTYRLSGTKRYVGNGSRGDLGLVFARTSPGVLGIRAVLVEAGGPGWEAEALDMVGLRGARLSEMRFDDVAVPADMLLGRHLPPTRRGIMGALRAFNHMRVQIASMALGVSHAIHEYVAEHEPRAVGVDVMRARLEAAEELTFDAARAVDADPDLGHLSSAAKLRTTRLAAEVAHWSGGALGPASFLEHPLLEKWSRDVGALEFMDGTGNIQRMHVAKAYTRGRMADV